MSRLPRKRSPKFVISRDSKIDYKNIALLQKFVTERGKILSRRNTGVSGSEQRQISEAVKRARFLGLLSVGSAKRR